jgi:hypothetical protein
VTLPLPGMASGPIVRVVEDDLHTSARYTYGCSLRAGARSAGAWGWGAGSLLSIGPSSCS